MTNRNDLFGGNKYKLDKNNESRREFEMSAVNFPIKSSNGEWTSDEPSLR